MARIALLCGVALAGFVPSGHAKAGESKFVFDLVRSPGLQAIAGCVPNASGTVTIQPGGPVEVMSVRVTGLPPKTDFDFFVIQQPNAPFGMSWYQGDIHTNGDGLGHAKFIGRFSIETFVVARARSQLP